MIYLFNVFVIVLSFVGMELVAWSLHKYVMHKFMWNVHKDHHIPNNKKFQRNDFFALVFGIPSWLLIMFGIMAGCDFRLYMGIGITLYGICYVLIHDGLIHQRFKVFPNTKSIYLQALKKGHWAHHKHDGSKDYNKDNDICYGMLWVPMRFFIEVKGRKKTQNT
ncbi:MAG: sterol desaturase family protein [Cyclobacteriaceae bacterium]|nr:sterol desaturase family protein [Cyclobacteriaceae bacterium]